MINPVQALMEDDKPGFGNMNDDSLSEGQRHRLYNDIWDRLNNTAKTYLKHIIDLQLLADETGVAKPLLDEDMIPSEICDPADLPSFGRELMLPVIRLLWVEAVTLMTESERWTEANEREDGEDGEYHYTPLAERSYNVPNLKRLMTSIDNLTVQIEREDLGKKIQELKDPVRTYNAHILVTLRRLWKSFIEDLMLREPDTDKNIVALPVETITEKGEDMEHRHSKRQQVTINMINWNNTENHPKIDPGVEIAMNNAHIAMMQADRLMEQLELPSDVDWIGDYHMMPTRVLLGMIEQTPNKLDDCLERLKEAEQDLDQMDNAYEFNKDLITYTKKLLTSFAETFKQKLVFYEVIIDKMWSDYLKDNAEVATSQASDAERISFNTSIVVNNPTHVELLKKLHRLRPANLAAMEDGPLDGIAQIWFELEHELQSIETQEMVNANDESMKPRED